MFSNKSKNEGLDCDEHGGERNLRDAQEINRRKEGKEGREREREEDRREVDSASHLRSDWLCREGESQRLRLCSFCWLKRGSSES